MLIPGYAYLQVNSVMISEFPNMCAYTGYEIDRMSKKIKGSGNILSFLEGK